MSSSSHPQDVLRFLCEAFDDGRDCALVTVTETVGGGLRSPGAMMAVDADGSFAGYVSNGCVDADVILQARDAIRTGEARHLTYGAGSPFLDIRLPCGGRLSMVVVPSPDPGVVRAAHDALEARKAFGLTVSTEGVATGDAESETSFDGETLSLRLVPKLRLRIAGRGEELIALARLAAAADFAVTVQSPDTATLARADALGLDSTALSTARNLPSLADDEWTAFVLMFHDQDWETPLLLQTFTGPAFWIGAVGSHRTHQARCEALHEAGSSKADIRRLKGPIGLIPRTRDASMLAVSTLAEIAGCYKDLEA